MRGFLHLHLNIILNSYPYILSCNIEDLCVLVIGYKQCDLYVALLLRYVKKKKKTHDISRRKYGYYIIIIHSCSKKKGIGKDVNKPFKISDIRK